MRLLLILAAVLSIFGCQPAVVVPPVNEAQLAALPPQQRARAIVAEFGKIPVGYQREALVAKGTLMDLANALQGEHQAFTQEELDLLLPYAVELDKFFAKEKRWIADRWISYGATPNMEMARQAARDGDLPLLKNLLKKGLSPLPDGKHSPLVFAVQTNRIDIVETLLNANFDPDGDALERNDPWQVPLYVASRYSENPQMVRVLLQAGSLASLDRALSLALENPLGGAIAAELKGAGGEAPLDAYDKGLLIALKQGKFKSAENFAVLGADPSRVSTEFCAIEPLNEGSVGFQNDWCTDPVAGFAPALDQAVNDRNLKMVETLLAAGASPNTIYGRKRLEEAPVVCKAASSAKPKIVKALLLAGANPKTACWNLNLFEMAEFARDHASSKERKNRAQQAMNEISAMGGREEESWLSFDTVMKTLTTAAVGGIIAESGIDAYHGGDLFAAAMKDVWSGGSSNSLGQLNKQYLNGDFSIKDPMLAEMMRQQRELERQQELALAELKRRREAEAARQRQARAELAAQAKDAIEARKAAVLAEAREAEKKKTEPKEETATVKEEQVAVTPAPKKPEKPKREPVANQNGLNWGRVTTTKAKELRGTLRKTNLQYSDIEIAELEVKYRLDTLMGEPTAGGAWKWTKGGAPDEDAKLPYDFVIWLKIRNGSAYGFVKLNPTVPKSGKGYGFNATGSPDWDDYICSFRGPEKDGCMTEEQAKAVFKGGEVVDFEVSYH